MDFKKASKLGSCLSRDYAEELFALLATYRNISASEAASRLNLHIKTVQDFLEDLFNLDLVEREEVYEGKRPYYRYNLKVRKITIDVDLSHLFPEKGLEEARLSLAIREKQNSGVRFTTSRSNDYISKVVIWTGEGRNREERKINLSIPQGRFLFHLPFPSAEPLSIREIIHNAGLDGSNIPEIVDIVDLLIGFGVIESSGSSETG
jgi:hypothetical protein